MSLNPHRADVGMIARSLAGLRRLLQPMSSGADLFSNLLILALVAGAALTERFAPLHYERLVQEDGPVEWASFWGFAFAAICFAAVVRHQRVIGARRWPWWPAGLAAFCALVALEEISWGQRVFGFAPPEFFLEHNFQQELNVHNVIDADLRKITLQLVIGGYGIVLPLLATVTVADAWLARIGAVLPRPPLIAAFAVILVSYSVYPLPYTGEWVELALGLAFLFTGLCAHARRHELRQTPARPARQGVAAPFVASIVVVVAGFATSVVVGGASRSDIERAAIARLELQALGAELSAARLQRRCSLHKRVYSYVRRYRPSMPGTRGIVNAGRARFYLDPWNSPYWIRETCDPQGGARSIVLYSFGPNRRRDSTEDALAGDDVGAAIETLRREHPEAPP